MPVVTCQSCSKKLKLGDKLAGKKVRCPGCGASVAVPRLGTVGTSPLRVRPELSRTESAPLTGPELVPLNPPPPDDPTGQQTDPPRAGNDQTLDGADADRAEVVRQLTEILTPPQGPGEIGRLGAFRVLKILGHGGMGVVYQAEDTKLERPVAIKAILPSFIGGASAGRRFLREARAMAKVEHPHVARIYQVDEDRGMPFLAMEFLKGESLEDRLKRDKSLPIPEVVRIAREIAEGLAAAHETGLIHRDIKPGNIWLEGPRRTVKILDFGLARAESEEGDITQSGVIVGTPAYMAPEQGQAGKVDARTDLFSLGVVLYRMIVGEMPFKGATSVAILMAIANDEPASPRTLRPETPELLDNVVRRLLAKVPAERFQTAAEVAGAMVAIEWHNVGQAHATPSAGATMVAAAPVMRTALAEKIVIPRTPHKQPPETLAALSPQPSTERPPRSHRGILAIAAAVGGCGVLAIVVATAIWLFRGRATEPIDPTQPDPTDRTIQPAIQPPKFALRFDGKDKVGPFPFELDLSTPFTLELTVSTPADATAVSYPLLSINKVNVAAGKNWRFSLVGQNLKFNHVLSTPSTPNVATPIAAVSTGKEARLFVNGVLQKWKPIDGDPPPDIKVPLELGYSGFRGIIREVRISKIARYEQSYTATDWLQTDEHTLALYHCDEGQGEYLKDSSGNNRTARIFGAQWVRADGAPIDMAPASDWVTPPIDENQAKAVQAAWAKKLAMGVEILHPKGLRFELIPPGMLATGEKKKRRDFPISQPFYLGANEVTVGQFRAFVKATGHAMKPGAYVGPQFQFDPAADWENPGWPQTADHPVTCVSWNDAQAYCAWLTKQGTRKYRLPTEIEWEHACRGGTSGKFFFGFAGDLDRYARHGLSAASRTHPVGELLPNPWGLHDVYGNVMEMCQISPEIGDSALSDFAVLRGGAWLATAIETSTGSDYRYRGGLLKLTPDVRCNSMGFRVLMELPKLAVP